MLEEEGADPTVERIALALRRPVDFGPDVDRAVMSAIRAAPLMVTPGALRGRDSRRSVWQWLVQPRAVRLTVSPIGALAAAGIAIVAALVGLRRDSATTRPQDALNRTGDHGAQTGEFPVASRSATPAVVHDTVRQFVLLAPGAKQVAIAGDFNDWKPEATPLKPVPNGNGLWMATVTLPPGRYTYSFYVDGQWKADPTAPRAVGDDFGRPSSVVTVREGMST